MISYRYPQEREAALILARELNDDLATAIIEQGSVASRDEAIYLSQFFWRMVDLAVQDRVVMPFDGSAYYWTEKLYNSLGAYLKSAGYDDEWNEQIDKA